MYRPDPERLVQVSLGPGQGERPFPFQNVRDRVVQQAAFFILRPLLDPLFADPASGHNPALGSLHELALAEWLYLKEGRRVWVTAVVDDAHAKVPVPEVVQLVRAYLLADDLAELVGHILGGASVPGLRPTGEFSHLLRDLYLYDRVGRPWRRRHPDVPLLRVGGEFLAPCRSLPEAQAARATLAGLLAGSGMPPRGGKPVIVWPDSPQRAAPWLWFRIYCVDGVMHYHVANSAFERLALLLSLAREDLAPAIRAERFIEAWVWELAPACAWENIGACEVYARVKAIAADLGFDKIPGKLRFRNLWRQAVVPWNELRGISAEDAQGNPGDVEPWRHGPLKAKPADA